MALPNMLKASSSDSSICNVASASAIYSPISSGSSVAFDFAKGRAERGIVDRDQRPQAAGRILLEQERLMAVVVGVTEHLSPCVGRVAKNGKRQNDCAQDF